MHEYVQDGAPAFVAWYDDGHEDDEADPAQEPAQAGQTNTQRGIRASR